MCMSSYSAFRRLLPVSIVHQKLFDNTYGSKITTKDIDFERLQLGRCASYPPNGHPFRHYLPNGEPLSRNGHSFFMTGLVQTSIIVRLK